MTTHEKKEIYRLYKLNDYKYRQELVKAFYKDNRIGNFSKASHKVINSFFVQINNNYESSIGNSLDDIKVKICNIYCKTRILTEDNINDLSELIYNHIFDLGLCITIDPLFISLIIKIILKKICKCGRHVLSMQERKSNNLFLQKRIRGRKRS